MKIHHLLGGISIAITNEERNFIKAHSEPTSLSSLDEHGHWLAQNLVRKNVYTLTNDSKYIVINKNETNQSTV